MNFRNIDTPINKIAISRSQLTDGKIVKYGDDNNYPTIIASLIDNSQTAKACSNILSQFIASGFVAEIGKTEVGKTFTGKAYTLNQLSQDIASSLSRFGGAFILCKKNFENQVQEVKVMRYEDCRFSAFDDNKFSNFVYYGDFSKTISTGSNQLKKAKKFPIFTTKDNVFEAQAKASKTLIQVYHIFVDNTYVYPLSPFDVVANDMNSEYQIQVNRQQELTQGVPGKILIGMDFAGMSEEECDRQIQSIKEWTGVEGSRAGVLEVQSAPDGSIANRYKVDVIQDNRNASAFVEGEKSASNNIRKACYGLPAVLIDYESGNLSNNSGEQIKTAYDYMTRNTRHLRELVSESLSEIFEKTTIQFSVKDFTLKTPEL
ncbi:MAG: hypothetical protein MJ197_08810 [Bacteroidales bacterium]|nr:hypothetical protein [Bacteroidales bacterium]